MNVSDILSDIDDHGFVDSTTTRKMAMLNETYWDICGREPWPFLEKTLVLTFDGISATPSNIPSDLRAVLTVQGSTGPLITPVRYDDWLLSTGGVQASGQPYTYFFQAGTMSFYPTPTAGYNLTLQYIAAPTDLLSTDVEATILIPKQFHRALLVNGTLYKLYAMEDDTDISPTFEGFYERALTNFREFVWKKQYDRPYVIHPVDPDDLGWDTTWGTWGVG